MSSAHTLNPMRVHPPASGDVHVLANSVSGSVLVEYHPEEYHYGKHETGAITRSGLGRSEFRTGRYCSFGCAVFLVVKYVGVCLSRSIAGNKRHASHCKAIAEPVVRWLCTAIPCCEVGSRCHPASVAVAIMSAAFSWPSR